MEEYLKQAEEDPHLLGIVLGRPKIGTKKGPGFYIQALIFFMVRNARIELAAFSSGG